MILKIKLQTIFLLVFLAIIFFNNYIYSQYNAEIQHNNDFTSREFNFSISFPNDNWTSSEEIINLSKDLRGKRFLFYSNYSEIIYNIIALDFPSTPEYWDGHFDNLIRGIEDFFEDQQSGWEIVNVSLSPSEIPLNNSKRFLIEFNIPDTSMVSLVSFTLYKNGTNTFMHGYIISGKFTYLFITVNPDQIEPLMFTTWVKSFRLLNPKANEYKQDDRFILLKTIKSIFLILLLLTIILDIIFILRKAMVKKTISVSTDSTLSISNKVSEIETKSKLTLWSKMSMVVMLIATYSIVAVKNYNQGLFYSFGYFLGDLILSLIVAFLVYGREKNQDWNKFARLFFWLTIILTFLSLPK